MSKIKIPNPVILAAVRFDIFAIGFLISIPPKFLIFITFIIIYY